VAAHLILRKLNLLIPVHTIMNSGGRFYLLLPNLPETTQTLKEVQCTVDNWFLQEMNGELSLNLACTEFGDDGFKAGEDGENGFSKVLEKVSISLNTRRQNRFAEALCVSGQ
jgi:CRISPR-associated protein Csm1